MTPITASPELWHAHPLSLGYGLAAAAGVLVVVILGAFAVSWWRDRIPRRYRRRSP